MRAPASPADLTSPSIIVSEHALLRYLERVRGIDMQAMRAEIEAVVARGAAVGAPTIRQGKVSYRMRGRVVITVTVVTRRKRKKTRSRATLALAEVGGGD